MDLVKLTEAFLSYCKDFRGYSKQTLRSYTIALEMLLEHHELEQKEGKIVLNIMPLRLYLAKHSKKAVAARLSAIRSFVLYLKEQHNLEIKLIGDQSVKVPKTLPKPIEGENILEVLAKCTLQERVIVVMLYALGLRISELAALKLSDISQNWVRVFGKGSKMREIPLLPSVAVLLKSYIQTEQPKQHLFEKEGAPLSSAQLRYRVQKAFKRLGIKATPHQLRHSFATELLKDGARISDVSELLGHSSMATTQIYTKLTNATKLKNYLKAHPLAKE